MALEIYHILRAKQTFFSDSQNLIKFSEKLTTARECSPAPSVNQLKTTNIVKIMQIRFRMIWIQQNLINQSLAL